MSKNLTYLVLINVVDDEIEEEVEKYRNHKSEGGLNKTDISDMSRQTSSQIGVNNNSGTPNLKGMYFALVNDFRHLNNY